MSLLELAMEQKKEFNPATDKINQGGDRIPVGTYDIVISDVGHAFYEQSGWENIVVECEVTIGEFAKRKENVTWSFIEEWNGKPIHEFILKRNMRMTQKLAYIGGVKFKKADFEDTRSVANALKPIIGTQAVLTITERENKKDPDNPYRSYEFEAYTDNVDLATGTDDDDLPF